MKGNGLTTHFLQLSSHVGGSGTEFEVIEAPHDMSELLSLINLGRGVVHHKHTYPAIELLLMLKLFSNSLLKLV